MIEGGSDFDEATLLRGRDEKEREATPPTTTGSTRAVDVELGRKEGRRGREWKREGGGEREREQERERRRVEGEREGREKRITKTINR